MSQTITIQRKTIGLFESELKTISLTKDDYLYPYAKFLIDNSNQFSKLIVGAYNLLMFDELSVDSQKNHNMEKPSLDEIAIQLIFIVAKDKQYSDQNWVVELYRPTDDKATININRKGITLNQ